MVTQIQKWGNSLALRIPKSFAHEVNVHRGSKVELFLTRGKLILAPISKPSYELKELLKKVSPQNIHHEEDYGPPMGKEVW